MMMLKYTIFLTFAMMLACNPSERSQSGDKKADEGDLLPVPVVTDARTDLVLTWFIDGGPQMAASAGEVPAEARGAVRVQDPTIPPEKRDPNVIHVVDLSAAKKGDRYPVSAMSRKAFEQKFLPKPKVPEVASIPSAGRAAALAGQPGGVIMYSTRTCSICVKARRWLLDNKIPFVEKNVDQDQQAAKELAQKSQAQGLRVGGVPVFDIGGRLLPGFDPAAIKAILSAVPASPSAPPTPSTPKAPSAQSI